MIFQVKKLFLSLIFTVALCCGLSVSASAYYYNLSDFAGSYWSYHNDSTTDTTSVDFSVGFFPLSRVYSQYSTNDIVAPHMSITKSESPIISNGDTFYFRYVFPDLDISSDYNRFYFGLNNGLVVGRKTLIFDYNKNGDNEFVVNQTGVSSLSYEPIYDGASIVGFVGSAVASANLYLSNLDLWLYGDFTGKTTDVNIVYSSYDNLIISSEPIITVSPTLSVTATDITSTSAQLNFTAENLDPAKQYQIRMEESANPSNSAIVATFSGSETFSESALFDSLPSNFTYNFRCTLIEDGVDTSATVDLSFTTLPKVYNPQISASQFSVTSNTFTSTVTLSDLDPTHTYKPFWALYAKFDMTEVISSGYAAEIGEVTGVESYTGYSRVVSLSPSTDYLINWTLLDVTDGKIVPSVSNVEFTTLGDGSGGGSGSSDDSPGILLMILNKVSAILDTLSGGQSEGLLASINEKLDALIDTLANPEEQQLEDNFKESLTGVNDNFFGDSAKGQAVTFSDVGNLADTQSTVKNIFQSDYTVTDFFNLFSDTSLFAWFSAETALDLNPNAYGGAALADMDDPYNMQSYYDNLEKVRGKK